MDRIENAINNLSIKSNKALMSRIEEVQYKIDIPETNAKGYCYCLKIDANGNLRLKEITGRQINELGYPEIRPEDYTYEIFNVHPSNESGNQYSDLVKEIISKPGHIEGAPIFITPYKMI